MTDFVGPSHELSNYRPLKELTDEYNTILDEDNAAMVEQAREIARRNNQMTSIVEEDDGLVVLTVELGG